MRPDVLTDYSTAISNKRLAPSGQALPVLIVVPMVLFNRKQQLKNETLTSVMLLLLLLRGRTGRGCDDRRQLLRGRPHQRVDETGKYGEQPAEIREKLQITQN